MDPLTLAVAGVAALAILLIAVGVATSGGSGISRPPRALRVRPEAETPRRRPTGQGPISDLHRPERRRCANLNKVVEGRDFGANLAREIARADLQAQAVRVPRSSGLGSIVGIPVAHVHLLRSSCRRSATRSSCSIGALIGFLLPRFWLNRRKSGRLNAFNKQLPDTITLIANALRAGSSFLQAIELVVRESRPPISTEFSRVIREVNLGLPFEQALENMVRRVRSDDLELMATAISIQHQVGGNLAEILDSIAYTIRERVRIKGEIRTLTAQQRLSGYVVGFLPIGLAGVPVHRRARASWTPMFLNPPGVARAAGRRRSS